MQEAELLDDRSVADFRAGDAFKIKHPFVREPSNLLEGVTAWRPGTRNGPPGYDGECGREADADGVQLLTVVSLHKPGKFHTRVFYTREWQSPDGRKFGNAKLKIASLGAFRRLVAGYRFEYAVNPEKQLEAAE